MNSLRDILHFMSECMIIVNSYLKEYLTERNFIVYTIDLLSVNQ